MIDFSMFETDSERLEFLNTLNITVQNGEVSVEELNSCLVNYTPCMSWLITILESVELSNNNLKNEYTIWYAEKFLNAKNKLSEGITAKTKLPSQEEIKNQVIVDNKEEWLQWQNKLQIAERSEGFYRRLNDAYKKNADILLALSNNMRQEMRSLSIQNKANQDIKKECLYRHVDTNETNDFECNDEIKVKKIKKTVE